MGRSGKSRQDKFYYLAKEQGYRSRAAFKLIQLNKRFNFLENSKCLVDLCAAPGGWLQVAAKQMKIGSIIIGIDLDPIKFIKGVKSFVQDITEQECIVKVTLHPLSLSSCKNKIKKHIKKTPVDVVLNDGAPNMGANWYKDAIVQNDLCIKALKLAVEILKPNGTFISKLFRSTDYNSVLWLFNKFFDDVQAVKPKASRYQSAEIFIVCQGFKAPKYIDDRLFDIDNLFKQTENDVMRPLQDNITSAKAVLNIKRNRDGYKDSTPMGMFQIQSLADFISTGQPYQTFINYSQISLEPNEDYQKLCELVKPPSDIKEICHDLKVLGRREMKILVKWRTKIIKKQAQAKIVPVSEEELSSDAELQKRILKSQKKQLKVKRKEREKKLIQLVKQKASSNITNAFIPSNQDQVNFAKSGDILKNVGWIDWENPRNQGEQEEMQKLKMANMQSIEDNLEFLYEEKKKVKLVNEQKQRRAKIQKQKEKYQLKGASHLKEKDYQCDKLDGNQQVIEEEFDQKQIKTAFFDSKIFQDIPNMKSTEAFNEFQLENPLYLLNKRKPKELESAEGNEPKVGKIMKKGDHDFKNADRLDEQNFLQLLPPVERQKQKKLQERIKRKEQRNKDKQSNMTFDVVPKENFEDWDIDDLAETLVIARKMLRKKDRSDIMDANYNKYTTDDHDTLPAWFVDDEKRHRTVHIPITKEEVLEQKRHLQLLKAADPKKVAEAKYRKKVKAQARMRRAQKKAEMVFGSDGISNNVKSNQIMKIYARELSSIRRESNKKQYKVMKKKSSKLMGNLNRSRNIKMVDKRMKADKRGKKIAEKRGHTKHSKNKHKNRRRKKSRRM